MRVIRSEPFAWISRALFQEHARNMGPFGVTIYMALACYANNETQNAWPSAATISEITGISERKVRTTLDELVVGGYLKETKQEGRTTIYNMQDTPAPHAPLPLHAVQGTPAPHAPELEEVTTRKNKTKDCETAQNAVSRDCEKRRNRKPLCEANQVHWDTTKRRLNDKQLAAIEATVTDVPLWQHLLDDWLMCGYNPGNVNGLLAAYQAGGLKTGRSQGGSYAGNRRHSQPDDTDSGWGVAPGTVRWADGAKPLDDDLFPVQGGGVGGAGQTTP